MQVVGLQFSSGCTSNTVIGMMEVLVTCPSGAVEGKKDGGGVTEEVVTVVKGEVGASETLLDSDVVELGA